MQSLQALTLGIEFEGFGDDAERFHQWLQEHGAKIAFLNYQFKRGEVREELLHDSLDAVRERVLDDARRMGNPMQVVIEGVDDAWEISLLRFIFEIVGKSSEINAFDFKRKGLL